MKQVLIAGLHTEFNDAIAFFNWIIFAILKWEKVMVTCLCQWMCIMHHNSATGHTPPLWQQGTMPVWQPAAMQLHVKAQYSWTSSPGLVTISHSPLLVQSNLCHLTLSLSPSIAMCTLDKQQSKLKIARMQLSHDSYPFVIPMRFCILSLISSEHRCGLPCYLMSILPVCPSTMPALILINWKFIKSNQQQ